MIWPAMLFNLCVGLLFAAYLLRAVRRFERRADAIMAKLTLEADSWAARSDVSFKEELRKYDQARDEIIASLRAKTDRAIAEMLTLAGSSPPTPAPAEASANGTHPTDGPAGSPLVVSPRTPQADT